MAFVLIKFLTEKLGKGNKYIVNEIHKFSHSIFCKYVRFYMCLVTIYEFWASVILDFIMENIGKKFD